MVWWVVGLVRRQAGAAHGPGADAGVEDGRPAGGASEGTLDPQCPPHAGGASAQEDGEPASGAVPPPRKQLGHASPATTANLYADVSFEDMQAGVTGVYE